MGHTLVLGKGVVNEVSGKTFLELHSVDEQVALHCMDFRQHPGGYCAEASGHYYHYLCRRFIQGKCTYTIAMQYEINVSSILVTESPRSRFVLLILLLHHVYND